MQCVFNYFVRMVDNELFYLDPHIVRPYTPVQGENMFPVEAYHCDTVRKVEVHQLDPSMMLGFLIKSEEDLKDFIRRSEEITSASSKMFDIHVTAPSYVRSAYRDELFSLGLAKHLQK